MCNFFRIVFCLLIILEMNLAFAQEKTVKVGWYDSHFCYTDNAGRRSGYAYEYQQKIAAYTGWKYEYVTGSWSQLFDMLKRGEIDLMSDISYTKERATQMLFSNFPMGSEIYYLFVNSLSTTISAHDLSTLNGKKIGVNKDSFQRALLKNWADMNNLELQIIDVTTTEEETRKMLKDGTIDGYVTLDTYEDEENHAFTPLIKIGSSEFFFAVNKNRQDLQAELNDAMSKINDENRYYNNQLYNKYLKSSGTNAFITDDILEWYDRHGVIRVGYRQDYMPFCGIDEKGNLKGVLNDFIKLAGNCLKNVTLQFEPHAYPTLLDAFKALQKGEIDCVFPVMLSSYDAEKRNVLVTTPFIKAGMYALLRNSDMRTISKDTNLRVAVSETNSNTKTFLRDNYPNCDIIVVRSLEECLTAVRDSRADCVFRSSYRTNLSTLNQYSLYPVATGLNMEFGFAVRRTDHELYYILNKVSSLVQGPAIDSAPAIYMQSEYKFSFKDVLSSNIEFVIMATVLIAILAIILLRYKMKRSQRELEEQLELKNKMLESEKKINEVDSIVASVASDYRSIFFVDLPSNDGVCYRAKSFDDDDKSSDLEGVNEGDHFNFYEKLTQYANKYVADIDRENFLKFVKPENLRKKIENEIMINYHYMTIRDGEEHFELIRIVNINLVQNRYGQEVKSISFGFANVDSETRTLLENIYKMYETLRKLKV